VEDGIGIGKYLGAAWVVGERHRRDYSRASAPIRSGWKLAIEPPYRRRPPG
jgi:hypothetical protein